MKECTSWYLLINYNTNVYSNSYHTREMCKLIYQSEKIYPVLLVDGFFYFIIVINWYIIIRAFLSFMQICIYKFVFSCTFLCFWRYNKNISRLILGSTELDDETGHKCKMPHSLYRIFCTSVLGLPLDSWAITWFGIGVQKSNPTRSWRDDVLLRHRHILQKQTHLPTRRPQGHGNDLHTYHPTPCRSWCLHSAHYQLVWGEDDDAWLAHVATCPSFDVTYSHSPK